jgi:hypothetical protein
MRSRKVSPPVTHLTTLPRVPPPDRPRSPAEEVPIHDFPLNKKRAALKAARSILERESYWTFTV